VLLLLGGDVELGAMMTGTVTIELEAKLAGTLEAAT